MGPGAQESREGSRPARAPEAEDSASRSAGPPERDQESGHGARYVAIITDGNGRWAARRRLPVLAGHEAGADVVKARLRDAVELGIEELTVYSFSTENWSRAEEEVAALMDMFGRRIELETPELHDQGVRMRFLGRRSAPVAPSLVERMAWAEDLTAANRRITLFVAFNYGGRAEIVDAVRSIVAEGVPQSKVDEKLIRRHLYFPDMPDPDLVVRTSGETRISNFLLWEIAYSELVFPETLWPDMRRRHLYEAVIEFQKRVRRFGSVGP
jgi:undecaprenyl diphosphate synthase